MNISVLVFLLTGISGLILSTQCFENSAPKQLEIGFVILSQANRHHNALAEFKKKDILNQAKELSFPVKVSVFKTHQDFDSIIGHWTLLPLFEKISNLSKISWFFFLDEATNIRLNKLIYLLFSYNQSHNSFVGHVLTDADPTIIHHFARTHDETVLSYPHFSAGFFISHILMKRLVSKCNDCTFSIDPKYELAKYIWDSAGVKLQHEPELCLKKGHDCATWIDGEIPNCGQTLASDKIFVAVKTCNKFHSDRVNVVKNTWGLDVQNLKFFSDIEDKSIPTIKLPIQNVPSGHCEKTLSIMKFYVKNNIAGEWLAIVDDDTLISFLRLRKLLTCYFPNEFVALGERYGYSVVQGNGYDYLTGGSGMIFSIPTVKQLVRSCSCPSIDSPDDMIIGLCLKNLNIPVIHSPFFHQARPIDYSSNFLKPLKHISFHKHWMVDPYVIYKQWLEERDYSKHFEL